MLLLLVALATVACTERRDASSESTATIAPADAQPAPASLPPGTITSPAGPDPANDAVPTVGPFEAGYLTEALRLGMGYVEVAQAVSRRSGSPVVDRLAGEIITAHNEINSGLARLAAANSVPLPADGAQRMQSLEARLADLQGQNLDAAYLAAILADYPSLLDLHGRASTNATDMNVKKLAVRAEHLLGVNLREARAAYAQVTGTAPDVPPKGGSPVPSGATQ